MKIHKTQENKNYTDQDSSNAQNGAHSTSQIIDNRPEATLQLKLQEMANRSIQVAQLQVLGEAANNKVLQNKGGEKENLSGISDNTVIQRDLRKSSITAGFRAATELFKPSSGIGSRTGTSFGTYADRERELRSLELITESDFKGKSLFESEHVLPYQVLNPGMARREARQQEGEMPAYYELYRPHRDHLGTGSSKESKEYRARIRTLSERGDIRSTLLLAIADYDRKSGYSDDSIESRATDDSYFEMLKRMESVRLYSKVDPNLFEEIPVTEEDKISALLARSFARKQIPLSEDISNIQIFLNEKYKIPLIFLEKTFLLEIIKQYEDINRTLNEELPLPAS